MLSDVGDGVFIRTGDGVFIKKAFSDKGDGVLFSDVIDGVFIDVGEDVPTENEVLADGTIIEGGDIFGSTGDCVFIDGVPIVESFTDICNGVTVDELSDVNV